MVALVLSSLSCCLKMAKIKAKQAREPVLKKNWRPMNLGKSEEPLNSGPPHSKPGYAGAGSSRVSNHHPLCSGDTEALSGRGLQPQGSGPCHHGFGWGGRGAPEVDAHGSPSFEGGKGSEKGALGWGRSLGISPVLP